MSTYRMQHNTNRGLTLLIAVLVTGIVLAIGAAILNVTLKEFVLSGLARDSNFALGAADAGLECALYWDKSSNGDRFDVGAPAFDITCMETTLSVDGTDVGGVSTNNLEFEWGSPAVCAEVEVKKYYSLSQALSMEGGRMCPIGNECTSIVSRGYNRSCADINTDERTVERALRALY